MTGPPPHDLDAERALLGTMLLSRESVIAALDVLDGGEFYSPAHREIFDAVKELHTRGDPPDPVTIAAVLRERSDTIPVAQLVELQAEAPNTGSARRLAEIVRGYAGRRAAIAAALELQHAAGAGEAELEDLIPRTVADLDRARQAISGERHVRHLKDGDAFVLDGPAEIEPVWGEGENVFWARGEPCLLCGPSGVGKTTLALQLLAGRLGVRDEVLGAPVAPDGRRVLYLALDRPAQIKRAMRRLFDEGHRKALAENLVVWEGPLPSDIGQHPSVLLEIAVAAGAGTVIIDSLKDAAVKLSDDETGGNINRAVQYLVSNGIEVLALHHQRKGQNNGKPNTLEDVYGSTWITAGAGSVVLLWGAAGDPLVELIHLKQPAAEIGPLKIEHDHLAGVSSVYRGFDMLRYLQVHARGCTVLEAARAQFEKSEPSDNEQRKARRGLDALVKRGLVHRSEPVEGGAGGSTPARYYPIENRTFSPAQAPAQGFSESSTGEAPATPDTNGKSAGHTTGAGTGATGAPGAPAQTGGSIKTPVCPAQEPA